MATYSLPQFNLLCNIFTSGAPGWPTSLAGKVLRLVGRPCALVYGQRTNALATGGTMTTGVPTLGMSLLLHPGEDVRGLQDTTGIVDVVEVPAGSGRWYGVSWVDDIGKGYANEHRSAMLTALPGTWLAPYA